MKQVKLKDVKPGDFLKRKPDAVAVYTRGAYDRSTKRFACGDWSDINREIYLRGDALVWVGFTF